MKNLFSKTLLCGVLASSFLLINCQKAPNRGVKAVIPPAKLSALKMGVCTQSVINEDKSFREILKSINDELARLKDTATDKLSEDEKNGLTKLANDYKAQAKKLTDEIEKLKAADNVSKAEGCVVHEGNDATKKPTGASYDVRKINSAILGTGKEVKAKTGKDNDITKGAAAETLSEGQELVLGAELAAALSDDASSRIAVAIKNSEILKDNDATTALADKSVTACSLNKITTKEEIKEGSKITIMSIEPVAAKPDDKNKRKVMMVSMTVEVAAATEGNTTRSLTCNVAATQEIEAEKAIRKALGTLVSEYVKSMPAPEPVAPTEPATPAEPVAPAPAPAEPVTPAPAPAPAPAEPVAPAPAAEGLAIMNKAMNKK